MAEAQQNVGPDQTALQTLVDQNELADEAQQVAL